MYKFIITHNNNGFHIHGRRYWFENTLVDPLYHTCSTYGKCIEWLEENFSNNYEVCDVAPVIHAKWQGFPYKCSNCGKKAPQETYYGVDGLETSDYISNYCPNCGAKMDKE